MADQPKYKIFIEGIEVPVQKIMRIQAEGEAAQVILYLWPTNKGTQIKRGSFVTIFRWEEASKTVIEHYPVLKKSGRNGLWELFWDGYLDRKPSVSRRESRSLILYCQQWSFRLNSMYMRAFNLTQLDLKYNEDRAFMGLNLIANEYFDFIMGDIESNIDHIQNKLLADGGIGEGLINMIKEAVNWDDLYARIESVANISNRFVKIENKSIDNILRQENIATIMAGQIRRMPSSTTLMSIINQIMYQALYTFVAIPSARMVYYTDDKGKKQKRLNQFLYKPQLFFATPIMSNLIFPSSIDSMEPIDTRIDQPTRVMIQRTRRIYGKYEQLDMSVKKEFFPEHVATRIATYQKNDDPKLEFRAKFTDEEILEERLVPGRIEMPFPDGLLHAADQGSDETIAQVYGRYMYEIERNISEPIRMQMKFDPYLVCGLSAAVFDEHFGYIMGRLRSIQDDIDLVNQTSKTMIELVNVRIVPGIENGSAIVMNDDDFQIDNYEGLFGGNAPFALFDDKFKNDRIGKNFYQNIFGVGAVNDVKGANGSIASGMKIVFDQYSRIGESLETFIQNMKHRPVVTEGQFMGFINATPDGTGGTGMLDSNSKYKARYSLIDVGLSGSKSDPTKAKPFMTERQEIITQYIKDIENAHYAKVA